MEVHSACGLRLRLDFFKRYNLLKNAMWQLIIVTVGCIIWDWLTRWHGWSIDFVLPGVSGLNYDFDADHIEGCIIARQRIIW